MNTFGHNFRITVWGESHGPEVGITIDGVPAGIALAPEDFTADLTRRRSGAPGTTSRREQDTPQVAAGLYNGRTTGAPLTLRFANENTRPSDYTPIAQQDRPSHADRAARIKWQGFNDPRGGGHLSGRLTVCITAAGVVAKKCLGGDVAFASQIVRIGDQTDPAQFDSIIDHAAQEGDSVGGVVECRVTGIAQGTGNPLFRSVESVVSQLLFSIPAVKGVEFGNGFASAHLRGSQNNDRIIDAAGHTATNHDGGINGGITNGNQIVVRVAIKPTPSIGCEQQTYNNISGHIEPLRIAGRHDTCIALRAVVVVEAAVAIALADLTSGS